MILSSIRAVFSSPQYLERPNCRREQSAGPSISICQESSVVRKTAKRSGMHFVMFVSPLMFLEDSCFVGRKFKTCDSLGPLGPLGPEEPGPKAVSVDPT
jgi:hypothetical protein